MKVEYQASSRSGVLIQCETDDDEQLLPLLGKVITLATDLWHRDQLNTAIDNIQAAYRRGDVQHVEFVRLLTSPSGEKLPIRLSS